MDACGVGPNAMSASKTPRASNDAIVLYASPSFGSVFGVSLLENHGDRSVHSNPSGPLTRNQPPVPTSSPSAKARSSVAFARFSTASTPAFAVRTEEVACSRCWVERGERVQRRQERFVVVQCFIYKRCSAQPFGEILESRKPSFQPICPCCTDALSGLL